MEVSLVSKASSRRVRSQRQGSQAGGLRAHADKSRVSLYAGSEPPVEEPTGAEALFEPRFADFAVPGAIRDAFGAFVAQAEGGEDADGAALGLGRVIRRFAPNTPSPW